MFKIQNKGELVALLFLMIPVSVIGICFEFRYSNFGFPRLW